MIKLITLFTYILLAHYTLKNIKIIVWLMAAVLVLSGVGATLFGLFSVGPNQYLLKIFCLIIGGYFVVGGIMLPKNRRIMEK